jgi:hypothetical protein
MRKRKKITSKTIQYLLLQTTFQVNLRWSTFVALSVTLPCDWVVHFGRIIQNRNRWLTLTKNMYQIAQLQKISLKSPEWLLCGLLIPHSFRRRSVQASKVAKVELSNHPNFYCEQGDAGFRLSSTLVNVRLKGRRKGLKNQN